MATISAKEFLKGGTPTLVNQGNFPNQSQGQSGGISGQISEAFRGGVSQMGQAIQESQAGRNPLETGAKFGAGAIGAIFSPLAPITAPINKGVDYIADKVGDNPTLQKFAMSKAGEATSRAAELTGNLSVIAGTAAGAVKAPPVAKAVVNKTVGAVKPTIAGTGRVLKGAGEGSYGITVTPSEGMTRALQTYKESTPNLANRIKNAVSGETKGKPITEANTAARYGLMGTEIEIGVQAGRFMNKIWKEKVQPALSGNKGKLDMNKLFDKLKSKIIKENPELTRRNALLSGLDDLKSEYGKVSKVGLEKLQKYKEGWTKFQSEQAWKGKPISSSFKEVMMMAGDEARDLIYKNTPEGTKQAYIDYGNLKSIREAGIKSGVGDLAKKSIGRGAWQFIMDKAITPVVTVAGKILYRTGEGLEFIGESGAKKVGDIVGDVKPK